MVDIFHRSKEGPTAAVLNGCSPAAAGHTKGTFEEALEEHRKALLDMVEDMQRKRDVSDQRRKLIAMQLGGGAAYGNGVDRALSPLRRVTRSIVANTQHVQGAAESVLHYAKLVTPEERVKSNIIYGADLDMKKEVHIFFPLKLGSD